MKQLKALEQRLKQRQQLIKDKIQKAHPIITDVRIYNSRNIYLESDTFSIDLYRGRTYTAEDIKMNCSTSMTAIPTEQEAIQKVRDMKIQHKQFFKAMNYAIKMLDYNENK